MEPKQLRLASARVVITLTAAIAIAGCGKDSPPDEASKPSDEPATASPGLAPLSPLTPLLPAAGGSASASSAGIAGAGDSVAPAAGAPQTSPTPVATDRANAAAEPSAAASAADRARASSAPSNQPGSIHTIARGDTLASVARAQGLKASDLADWNGIDDPRRLRIGQKLRLAPP